MARRKIVPVAPYSLSRTIGAFSRFPQELVDIVHDGGYRRVLDVSGESVLAEVRQESGRVDQPLNVTSLSPISMESDRMVVAVRRMLATDQDVIPVLELLQSHTRLQRLAKELHGLRRTLDPTPFEGLVSSILAQLVSVQSAASVRARVVKKFGSSIRFEGRDYWSFPSPEKVSGSSVDDLCRLGMTSAKARAILAVAHGSVAGELNLDQLLTQRDEDARAHLLTFPGVGPWTVDWFFLNVLGRTSVVPVGDLGVRRSTGRWLGDGSLPTPDEVRGFYEGFGDLCGYVAYFILSAERFGIDPF